MEPFIFRSFSKDLKKPVKAFNSYIQNRKGFYIEVKILGQTLQAEVSPLGATDSLLLDIKKDLELNSKTYYLLIQNALEKKLTPWQFKVPSPFPSIRFAMASLYLDCLSLGTFQCHVNGLLDAQDPQFTEKLKILIQSGITACKLKVSSQIEVSKSAIHTLLKTPFQLRVDANQALTLESALELCQDLPKDRIDYFEEPLKTPELLEQFFTESGFKYALDENIADLKTLKDFQGLAALVIKPSLIGDFTDLSLVLNQKILPITVSSTYETDIGLKHLILWAQFLNPTGHHGLDTFDIYADSQFKILDGQLHYE